MIEIKQRLIFILLHPNCEKKLEIEFFTEKDMDEWLPYLNKFEDYLIQEALRLKKQ